MDDSGIYGWKITIDELSKTPKYLQIVYSILRTLEGAGGEAPKKLPSINSLLSAFDISRDTVVKAYEHLKDKGIVESVPGKGYYVKREGYRPSLKVLLLFNKLSIHKKIIYDAFVLHLGKEALVDFYIYHNDFQLFKKILLPKLKEDYNKYVIIGHFLEGGQNAADIINIIPKDKLIILDKNIKGIQSPYGCVYQDFENDIMEALELALNRLVKYRKIVLVFPDYTYQPEEIISGFIRFCSEYALDYDIIRHLDEYIPEVGVAYVVLMEDDLITLIKKVKSNNWKVGLDIGIISYNETPLKEILLDGITTVSTAFEKLGERAAQMVISGEKVHMKNDFYLTLRNSL